MKILESILIVSTSLVVSATAFADIFLSGEIEPIVKMEINQSRELSDLNLTEDANGLVIASTVENSNVAAGYNVVITTENNFNLVSPSNEHSSIPYSLAFGDVDVLSAQQQGLPAFRSDVITNGETHLNVQHELKISYSGRAESEIIAGDYNDSIAIRIQAN